MQSYYRITFINVREEFQDRLSEVCCYRLCLHSLNICGLVIDVLEVILDQQLLFKIIVNYLQLDSFF